MYAVCDHVYYSTNSPGLPEVAHFACAASCTDHFPRIRSFCCACILRIRQVSWGRVYCFPCTRGVGISLSLLFSHNGIDDDFNGSAGVPVPLDHVLDLFPALRSLASQRIPAISQTVTNVHFPSLTLILLRSIQ